MDKLMTKEQYARIKKENDLVSYDGTNFKDADGNTIEVGGGETNIAPLPIINLTEESYYIVEDGKYRVQDSQEGITLNVELVRNACFLIESSAGNFSINFIDSNNMSVYVLLVYTFDSNQADSYVTSVSYSSDGGGSIVYKNGVVFLKNFIDK